MVALLDGDGRKVGSYSYTAYGEVSISMGHTVTLLNPLLYRGYVHDLDYDLLYAPHMKNIMGIAVSSAYKRKGIGSALLQYVENWALETGASGIRLVSGATRTDAHAFYRHCGFEGNKEQINLKKMF